MATHTLVHRIADWADRTPHAPATHVKDDAGWQTRTWRQHWEAVTEVGRGLIALGHQPGQCVAMAGANRPEYVQTQFGIQAIGGIPAPTYPTSTEDQLAYITGNCEARIVVCDNRTMLDKYLAAEATGELERLSTLIVFDDIEHEDARVMTLGAVRELGRSTPSGELEARMSRLREDDTCMLIYTSGTTGKPKGVMLDHAGQLGCIEGVLALFPVFRGEVPYRVVSYLPLSHQTEQVVTNVGAILTGGQVYFCPEIGQVREYLVEARPTLFMAVPRVWEKFEAALRARLSETSGVSGLLAKAAMATELAGYNQDVQDGRYHGTLPRRLARRLVIDKIKYGLGLDQLAAGFTGSAPLGVETMRFFASLGIPIHEAFGMSETSGVATVNPYGRPRIGTVGKPVEGAEIRIADDGEIMVKGRLTTRGYWRMPEETEALYAEDGFMYTGDLGEIDGEGNLKITGRKKELLITAGGKNVAPVELEDLMKTIPGVGQAVVVGDRQPYLSALISLDPDNLATLARNAGVPLASMAELADDAMVRAHLIVEVERACNSKVARYQTIKKIDILPHELTVEGNELTPTLKLRRREIVEKHADRIALFYADKNAGASAAE